MTLPGRSIEAGDLLHGEDHDFVVNLYLALLRRWPDPGGYRHHLDMVANRPERRVEAIRLMAGSEEARRAGAAVAIGPDPVLPSDPRRALAAMLELRTGWLQEQVAQLREAVELLSGPGGPELAGLGAELIEGRDAALRSEINALRRETGQRLEAILDLLRQQGVVLGAPAAGPEAPVATPEERAAQAVSRLVADYVGDLLAIAETRFEARLRAIEARLLAQGGSGGT
ncbi:DUF4214 domain-containing protein [Siccirubricoccus sp. G192]|uniref:DUF4214 domain-containing protein n=1 Tax=Siccirubricoccus sp. G192 TaxID=2849651 RepID=UPI001C2CB7DB|nr:DUF4214 domain-containing protein [Siccirubricoccus sp. G192]MBV1799608.1 DUF4214 domain-containing protein [Siccirubricoccus sp. G192]